MLDLEKKSKGFVIVSDEIIKGETYFLGWQDPGYEDTGYFWTEKKYIYKLLKNGLNTKEHPFIFKTKDEAQTFMKQLIKSLKLSTRCYIKSFR